MSMRLMALAMSAKVGNPARKLVLLKLCDNANDKGECWPSLQHIADQCEISRRTAISHVQALADDGYLVVENRFKNNEQISNFYIIDLEQKSKKTALGGENSALPPSEKIALGGEIISLGGENSALPPSEKIAHRTSHSFEPVIEPVNNSLASQANPTQEKKSNRGTRLPTDWRPTLEYWYEAKLINKNITDARLTQIAAEFRDYWLAKSGAGATKNDWLATWRNWIRREKPAQGSPPQAQYLTAREKNAQRNAEIFDINRARDF